MTELKDRDWELVRYIQGDLPEGDRPYDAIAKELGWSEQEVLERIRGLMNSGAIKRFGALVRHQHLGFQGNAMVAWQVPECDVDSVGGQMAAFPFVSHCYERITREDWPYNLYTMIHAASSEEAGVLVRKIAREMKIKKYKIFLTIKEWKKKSMEYT